LGLPGARYFTDGGAYPLVTVVAYFTPWYNRRQNPKYPGEVLIAPYGTYFSHQLHLWDRLGTRLDSVELKEPDRPYIEFKYEALTRAGMREYDARVQVPKGKDKEARELVDKFSTIIKT